MEIFLLKVADKILPGGNPNPFFMFLTFLKANLDLFFRISFDPENLPNKLLSFKILSNLKGEFSIFV